MKKLALLCLLAVAGSAFAETAGTVNKSSFTKTNDTAYINARILDRVIVGVASAGGILSLYNSTFTTSVAVSSISLATVGDYAFGDLKMNGIYYVIVGNSAGVSILYK